MFENTPDNNYLTVRFGILFCDLKGDGSPSPLILASLLLGQPFYKNTKQTNK